MILVNMLTACHTILLGGWPRAYVKGSESLAYGYRCKSWTKD